MQEGELCVCVLLPGPVSYSQFIQLLTSYLSRL